jgi:hypothetical protein
VGKRANIARTRRATEASARELVAQSHLAERAEVARRAQLTPEQRAAEDAALAEYETVRKAKADADTARTGKIVLGVIATIIAAAIGSIWGVVILWAVVVVVKVIVGQSKAKTAAAAQAAADAAEAERAQLEEARQAQLQYHVVTLTQADPVYQQLEQELKAIPPTRPEARRQADAARHARMVIISSYAEHFAELERSGRPVPDHGAAMRDLVAKEQAWDARSSGRHRPQLPA